MVITATMDNARPSLRMIENSCMRARLRVCANQSQARQSGFSLIEIMVAITIMGILLSIAIPAFQTWRERSALRSASETMMAHLKQARHLAHTGNRNVVFTINNVAESYTLDDGCTVGGVACTTIKTVDLDSLYSNTLEIGPATTVNSLTFKSTSWMGAGTISIKSTKLNEEKTIVVNSIGRAYWQ